jgi:Surface antigen variable number repeat
MARHAIRALGLLALICGLIWSPPSWAQSPPDNQRCYSSTASSEKPQTSADWKEQNSDGERNIHRKVIVDRIEFDRPVHLSDSDVEQIIRTANEMEADADADSRPWVDELTEVELRNAWQDQGYFKILLTAQARPIGGDSDHERFVVAVHVENEGPQFHLGDIRFTGGKSLPEAELRQVIPLREGEIFSVAKVRASFGALAKLYGSYGYIDFTATADTVVDENLQRISLGFRLDEQKQFRVGSVEIRGLDPSLEARLRSIIVPGEVINMEPITVFFKENESTLPPRGMDNLQILRNVRAGIVDLTFDPRSCRSLGAN